MQKINKYILLTGGTGYLGSHLLERLICNNYKIIVLKRSFSNTSRIKNLLNKIVLFDIDKVDLETIFEKYDINLMIHCATHYGRKDYKLLDLIDANLLLPLKLLNLCLINNVNTFINTDTLLDKRINQYSLSKRHFREWLENFSDRIKCINLALEHFYGPEDDKTKFISFIINEILNNKQEIELTKGEQKRDFIFIDDVVDVFIKIIESLHSTTKGFFHYEIGSGINYSIKSVITLIKEISGNNCTLLDFGAIEYRENEVMDSKADISKLRKLGWNPKIELKEGLMRTINRDKELFSK